MFSRVILRTLKKDRDSGSHIGRHSTGSRLLPFSELGLVSYFLINKRWGFVSLFVYTRVILDDFGPRVESSKNSLRDLYPDLFFFF